MIPLTFTFITEDGEQKLSLTEYHTKPDLMNKVGLVTVQPDNRRTLFLGTTIISYPLDFLEKNRKAMNTMEELQRMHDENPFKYFVPQTKDATIFLNDTEHNFKAMLAGNGWGKSCVSWIDIMLDIIDCDPSWPIFALHGVKHRRYKGPRTLGGVGIVSYEWNNHITTIWPQIIKRWTPKADLGEWGPDGGAVINWKNNPRCEIAGTPVWFFACSQAQTVFEASAMDIYWWDEQGEEDKFNGANMRIRRRNGRHVMSMTPHRVDGRPDTGAGSFIHKMYTGEMSAGLNPVFYQADIFGLPDWIYASDSKKAAKKEWEDEPLKMGNISKLREGRARLYGEFHESSGLVFDEFQKHIHCIEPFAIPKDWTRYRYIDHGRIEPTACLWAAVNPEGLIFLYREYYQTDKTIADNAKAIIELSGNTAVRVEVGEARGAFFERYVEVCSGPNSEQYARTYLDCRSMGKHADNSVFTIGDLYRNCGLACYPSDGQAVALQVPVAKDLLRLDPDRRHWFTGEPGAPRIYFFGSLEKTIWEISKWINKRQTRKSSTGQGITTEAPIAKDDHLMSCLLWVAMSNPMYYKRQDDKEYSTKRRRDPITGY